ncbi:MAG: hypothetical protein ACREUO_02345 [Burkholderiales bacterium]
MTGSRCPRTIRCALDNVTLCPHLGYVSEDVYATFHRDSVENVEACLDGKPIRVVNPEALK